MNKSFCPDRIEWEPRQLEHGNQAQGASYVNEKEGADEDQLLIRVYDVLELIPDDDTGEQLEASEQDTTSEAHLEGVDDADPEEEAGKDLIHSGNIHRHCLSLPKNARA